MMKLVIVVALAASGCQTWAKNGYPMPDGDLGMGIAVFFSAFFGAVVGRLIIARRS